jgi:xanthine dehydrogenase YagR molybdenum-binding subunit
MDDTLQSTASTDPMNHPKMGHPQMGHPQVRIDGRAKVTGGAQYPSDEAVTDPAYAFLLTSAIARGHIACFDLEDALDIDGVLDILTHQNVGGEASPPAQQSGGKTTTTLESDRVWHDGQIIGVVVANSYEIAREAAFKVRVHYHREAPSATFGSPGVEEKVREPGEHEDYAVGDVQTALNNADVAVDAWFETPTQHHNAIEPFTTT